MSSSEVFSAEVLVLSRFKCAALLGRGAGRGFLTQVELDKRKSVLIVVG